MCAEAQLVAIARRTGVDSIRAGSDQQDARWVWCGSVPAPPELSNGRIGQLSRVDKRNNRRRYGRQQCGHRQGCASGIDTIIAVLAVLHAQSQIAVSVPLIAVRVLHRRGHALCTRRGFAVGVQGQGHLRPKQRHHCKQR